METVTAVTERAAKHALQIDGIQSGQLQLLLGADGERSRELLVAPHLKSYDVSRT